MTSQLLTIRSTTPSDSPTAIAGDITDLINYLAQEGFHLCGSRHFHAKDPLKVTIGPTTDWDFCGEYGEETTALLARKGFVSISGLDSPYNDETARTVMTHPEYQVQVVLRADVDQYMAMLNSVSVEFFVNMLWKSGPAAPSRESIQMVVNQLIRTHEAGWDHLLSSVDNDNKCDLSNFS